MATVSLNLDRHMSTSWSRTNAGGASEREIVVIGSANLSRGTVTANLVSERRDLDVLDRTRDVTAADYISSFNFTLLGSTFAPVLLHKSHTT